VPADRFDDGAAERKDDAPAEHKDAGHEVRTEHPRDAAERKDTQAADAPGRERSERRTHWWQPRPPSYAGLVGGLIFLWFSLTPSLLPLDWLYQGIASGGSIVFGYMIGAFLGWATRMVIGREIPGRVMRVAWLALAGAGGAALIGAVIAGHHWQNEMRTLVDEGPESWGADLAVIAVALVIALILLGIGRLLRLGSRALGRLLGRWIPRRVGITIAWIIVLVLALMVANRVLIDGFIGVMDNIYSAKNETTKPGVKQPQQPERSGSSASLVSWQSLGYQGRSFVGRGPTQQQLRDFNGAEPKEPIRAYVGLDSAATADERATLAVKELERTNAFDRAVLCVATPTGTGWLEPQSVDTLEYEFNGDTAIVAIQYSYLPSWISFLFGSEEPRIAGKALFEAVYERWSQLPEGQRPRLIAYGLSLGSYGMQGAFGSDQDLTTRTQGALFVGTPNYTQLWRDFETGRDDGSPEWLPIYNNGKTVRFAAAPKDFARPDAPWDEPYVIYLQHASDPVVWWSWDLLLHKPDWLRETRGPDVSPSMHWYPFVTWAQVSVNQFVATLVPPGHGHNYGNMAAATFAKLLSPPGWTDEKTQALQTIINGYAIE
jgi:uncharacterized membrane protein